MDLVDKLAREIEAAAAAGRLAEMAIDLTRASQPIGGRSPYLAIPVTVADAYVHGPTIYE